MAGIGDYVHLFAESFKKYGITYGTIGEEKQVVQYQHESMYSKVVDRGKTPLTEQQVKELEDLYNEKSMTENIKWEDINKKVHNAVIDKLKEDCGNIMEEWFQKDSQWVITPDGTVQLKTANLDKSQRVYTIKESLQVSTVIRRLEQLQSLLTDVFQDMDKDNLPAAAKEYLGAKKSVKGISTYVKGIYNYLNNQLQLKNIDSKTKFSEVLNKDEKLLQKIDYINKIIQMFCACPPISYIEGAYREIFAKTFVEVLQQEIDGKLLPDIIKGISKSEVVGTKSSSLTLINANFAFKQPQTLNQKSFTDIFQDELGRTVKLEGYPSTSKADVIIEWKDGKSIKSTGISVKNYHINKKAGRYVSLVDGTSIFILMSNWNPEFATTFLNLYSTHPDDKQVDLTTERKQIALNVLYTIVYQSLTGDVFGRDKSHLADVFLFYNPSIQKYKIIQISTLLQNLQNLGTYTTPISIKINGQSGITSSMMKGENPWQFKNTEVVAHGETQKYVSARERIIRLLADSHNKKLHVSLNLDSAGNIAIRKS